MISLVMNEYHQISSDSRKAGWVRLAFVDLRLSTGCHLDLLGNNNNFVFSNSLAFTDCFFLINMTGNFQFLIFQAGRPYQKLIYIVSKWQKIRVQFSLPT